MTHKLALVGRDISHSKSQSIYEEILKEKVNYTLYDYNDVRLIPTLENLFSKGLEGLSITAPYKSHFIDQVKIESEVVKKLGVINCIKKSSFGYIATNTDYLAVVDILNKNLSNDTQVIILGDGKMASVCIEVLSNHNIRYKQYSRKVDGNISHLDFSNFANSFIINTCSRSYVFKGKLSVDCVFWDMNYSHQHNESYINNLCQYQDGLELLMLQGKYAVDFWALS